MKEMEKFGILINSIKELIKKKNKNFKSIWPNKRIKGPIFKFRDHINSIKGVIEEKK